jgi:hypothetical protein
VLAGGSSKDATHDLLATFDNGDVICLSADLDIVRWVANLTSLVAAGNTKVELEHVALANARSVTRGLLRSREDIAAVLNPTSDESSDLLELTQILCTVGRKTNGTRVVTLISVQPRSADLTTVQLSPLKHLVKWDLPKSSKASTSTASVPQHSIHASSGAVHTLVDGILLSYDLSGTIPKLDSELHVPGSNVDSFLRLSQDLIFTTSQSTCRVFDVKYNSLQAILPLGSDANTSSSASPSKKRKHAQPETTVEVPSPYNLVAYYAELGLVVTSRDDEIFGMQFGGSLSRKRVKTVGTLLIDALGKGIASKKTTGGYDAHKWQERKAKLNRYARKGKIAHFEQAFATDLGIQLDSADLEKRRENEVNGGPLTNGVGPSIPDEDAMVLDMADEEAEEGELRTWKMPETIPDNQRQQYRQYALYALSKIFRWTNASSTENSARGSLKVDFFAPNVFQWLLHTGHLTKESIRKAFLEESTDSIQNVSFITDGDIVKALVEFDADLHILSAVLNHSHFLPVGEVVQAIKLLMQSLDDEPQENGDTKLLTNGTDPAEAEMEVDITSELDAASHEIDHALSILDHGLLTRSHTLRPALIRLHTFPAPVISATLRSMLPRRDLESLIRLLHLELRNGGWTSSYDFADTEMLSVDVATEDPDDHAVAIIASLLSNTLDAIGAGAWLASVGNVSSSETSEQIIEALHSDTSEALNGFFEARFMRGLLSEFLRFATTLPKSHKPSNKTLERQGKPFAVTGQLDGDEDLPMLPLGGKADMGVDKMKKSHGGRKEERSKREMGLLISKRVPKYSFERIVI